MSDLFPVLGGILVAIELPPHVKIVCETCQWAEARYSVAFGCGNGCHLTHVEQCRLCLEMLTENAKHVARFNLKIPIVGRRSAKDLN